jgi:hypothetical protein
MSDPYDEDTVRWSERQAMLLRCVASGEPPNEAPDWLNIIEEIESVGRSERSALASRVRTIIEHLAKLEASPAIDPRASWMETVSWARADIEELLEASPSLKATVDKVVARECSRALRLAAVALAAHRETSRVPLEGLRYSSDQVLGPRLPEEPSRKA